MLARAPRTVAEIDAEIGAVGVLRRQAEENARQILEGHNRAQQGSLLRRGLEDMVGDGRLPAASRQAAQEVLEELGQLDRVMEGLRRERESVAPTRVLRAEAGCNAAQIQALSDERAAEERDHTPCEKSAGDEDAARTDRRRR